MADKFKVGDRVFAKMKGWPPWPAMVRERVPGKVETYNVYFYGTYESAKIKPDCMYLYNEESKEKYGKLQRMKARFKEAMIEMEDNIAIEEGNEAEYLAELKQSEADVTDIPEDAPGSNHSLPPLEPSDSEEGELLIDEGPPVLKKETKAPKKLVKTPAPKRTPKGRQSAPTTPKIAEPEDEEELQKPPTPPPVKATGRRASKGKRDSISLPTPEPKVETPAVPQPEIVSRSGRKIKPKRFADDEIQFGTKSSTSSPNFSDDVKPDGPPSAKRSKRVSSAASSKLAAATVAKVDTTPLPPPPRLEKAKLISTRTSIEKKAEGSEEQPVKIPPLRPPPPLRKFDAKPNLTPNQPPTLKPAPSKPPSLARLPPLVGRKSLPELESPASPILEPPASSEAEKAEVDSEDGEVFGPDSPTDEEQEVTTPGSPPEEGETNEEDEEAEEHDEIQVDLELEDVESDEEMLSSDSDSPPTPSPVPNGIKNSPPRGRQKRRRDLSSTYGYEPVEANMTKRMKVELKNGASAVLSFNYDRNRPLLSGKSNLDWDIATAKNLLKAKSELENNPLPFMQRIVESMAEVDARARIFKQSHITERVQKKIEQLRMEGELIEIIGEIVGCLNLNSPDCDRALDLLQRLITIGLNTLALKKHPEVVDTVRKLKNYHGNASNWKLTEAQTFEFNKKAQLIRDKSENIYEHLKSLFCSTPDKPFHKAFHEEVEKFKDLLADLPENQILGISTEPANRVKSMVGSRPNSKAKVEVKENHQNDEEENEDEEELEDVDSPDVDMDTDGLSPVSV